VDRRSRRERGGAGLGGRHVRSRRERIDFGPTTDGEVVCGDDLEMLRSASDGSTPFVWRVALADDDGNEALSLPRRSTSRCR
jgi:hypothetical protein